MTLLFHMRLSGAILILLGLSHSSFDRYLNWRRDISQLTPINRRIFTLHWFYIALGLILMGLYFCLLAPQLLIPQPLSRGILFSTTLIWALRLVFQWFLFDGASWRRVHYLLTAIWIYLFAVNFAALLNVLR